MVSIFYTKFLKYLEVTPFFDLFTTFAKVATWLTISIILINMQESKENIAMLVKWNDFAILKILTSFLLVFHIKAIIILIKKAWKSLMDEISADHEWSIYQGIPVTELTDYVVTSKSYSRAEFCERFAVARSVFDDLADGLDKIGVFVRGRNNAREISKEFSREDIASILTRASQTWEIRPLIRKTDSGYTHSPSKRFTIVPLNSGHSLPV